tara:strand:- start:50 stop:964 length:915 start_codon:yes stop_codon:yes gene_type:complete
MTELHWPSGSPYPDMGLFASFNGGNTVRFGGENSVDTSECGWSLNHIEDIYADCAGLGELTEEERANEPPPPEQISGDMNTNGILRLWYGQWSDCATQLATTSVTGKMIINNTGDFDISINGTGISAGAQLTINNLNWDYAGYNVGDQGTDAMDYYSGGTEYEIVGCDNCPTQTATVTHTPTPSATGPTPTATDAAGGGGDSGCCSCGTDIYAFKLCGGDGTVLFAYGHTDGNTFGSVNQSARFLDINDDCNPVCGYFVNYTGESSGTVYGPGDNIDDSVDTEAVAYYTIEGSNTVYSDCSECA